MKPKPTLSAKLLAEVKAQLYKQTAPAIIEAIAVQLHQAREARERIEREGSVVRDMRGSVIAHPAIKIEADAIKLYTALVGKNS